MKNKEHGKKIFTLFFIFLLLLVVFCLNILVISEKKQLVNNKENDLEPLKQLEQWYKGDKYELRDPYFNETVKVIENYTSYPLYQVVEEVKNQGIRCATAEIIMRENDNLYMYKMIAFNTIDKGIIYFDTTSGYRVIPEIGKSLVDCITGASYTTNYDDTIKEIMLIW